jgi:hypothetical protein
VSADFGEPEAAAVGGEEMIGTLFLPWPGMDSADNRFSNMD